MADAVFKGQKYRFPDGMSSQEMLDLMEQHQAGAKAKSSKVESSDSKRLPGFTEEELQVSPEKQLERDKIAAGIRLKEAGGQKEVASRVQELKDALQVKPMNSSARQILQLELKLWEMAKEAK